MMILLLIGLLIGPCLTTCAFPGTLSSACSALNGMTVTSRCDSSSSYRTSTGQCNNLQAPYLGAAITPFRRLIKSNYDDKISTPRQFKMPKSAKILLPNARIISRKLFPQSDNEDLPWQQSPESPERTNLASVFGQFLTHDITLTWNGGKNCSKPTAECFEIPVSSDDPVFVNLIPMNRAARCKVGDRKPEEQVNAATSFIDASHIYGNNEEEEMKLRDLTSVAGLLRTTCLHQNVKNLLPQLQPNDTSAYCRSFSHMIRCFYTGDYRRNNVSPALNALHTIWVREHNRIALALRNINAEWESETIFQETKKIIGAMMQHIAYKEYLPTILSDNLLRKYDLNIDSYTGYNSSADPTIANSFAAAALRFGHSTVGNVYTRPGHFDVPISDYHNPTPLYDLQSGGVDGILRGLLEQSARKIDRYFSWSVTKHLIPGPGVVGDLVAINIQRGRDHGITPYVKFRDFFDVSNDSIPADVMTELLNLYANVRDVDLYVGGLLEKPEDGAHVGPTFSHILAEGFRRLRSGDRFWYQNTGGSVGFSAAQVREIQATSLAKIICDNSDGIVKIQRYALLKEGPSNQKVDCEDLPFMDLSLWKQQKPITPQVTPGKSPLQDSLQDATFNDVKAETDLEKILTSTRRLRKRFKEKREMPAASTSFREEADIIGSGGFREK